MNDQSQLDQAAQQIVDQVAQTTPAIEPAVTPPPVTPEPAATPEPVTPTTTPEPTLTPEPSPTTEAPATDTPATDAGSSTTAAGEPLEGKGAGKYQVKVIADKCIGAASCVAVAPQAFKLNDQQIAIVLDSINKETDENLLLSAQSCPTLAIEVIDTETGEKVWPK